jgi:NAD(P)-dependent dehydrogenase (short-subunit alcohol dehydrogenase family)
LAVTGSASGIGAAVAERIARSGTTVIGVDQAESDVRADLATAEGRRLAVDEVARRCEGRLDGLVVAAGVGPQVQPTGAIVRVNYFGALVVLDGLLETLASGEAPAAVVLASNSAGITPPDAVLLGLLAEGDEEAAATRAGELDGATVYGMSKLGLARAVRRRARPWGEAGVRLNAVAPGPVDTPLLRGTLADPRLGPAVEALPIPLRRRAAPEEIAAAVAFLLDPANAYVHGAVLFVDGGTDAELRPDAV